MVKLDVYEIEWVDGKDDDFGGGGGNRCFGLMVVVMEVEEYGYYGLCRE